MLMDFYMYTVKNIITKVTDLVLWIPHDSWTEMNPRQSKHFPHFMEPEGSILRTQQLFPILIQINPVYALPPQCFNISFNITFPPMPGLQSSHLSPTKPVSHSLLLPVCHMICQSHPMWCKIILTVFADYKSWQTAWYTFLILIKFLCSGIADNFLKRL